MIMHLRIVKSDTRIHSRCKFRYTTLSPDLNHIENVWAAMKSGLRNRPVAGSSDELFALLTEMWDSLDALPAISSMRRRLVATIDAEGGHTKY